MKVIHVGVGGFGKQWVRVLRSSRKVRVVALVDVSEPALAAAREAGGYNGRVPCFTSLQEALRAVPADALVCSTPPDFHREQVVAALRAGLHAVSEKPMANTLADCKAMLRAARETGNTYVVSQNYRYRPEMWTIAELVRKGGIGAIGQVRIDFHKGVAFGGFRAEMEYPLLIDMSIHHFDLIRFVTGLDPVSVQGTAWNPAWSHYKGDCSSSVVFELSNGCRVVYDASWCAQGDYCDWNGNWQIEGTKGTILYRNGEIRLLKVGPRYKVESSETMAPKPPPADSQHFVLADFMRAVKNGRRPKTDVYDNIKSVAMVFAAVKAVKTGRKVAVLDKDSR
ncbi:MAG: Gfo/Idh/MocA family oxidoreductase [Kiritimatiellae bacterium]|nr:Gfo/Idh/MocA family oxidoreductase [Kiritimatiellia bacterium]